MHSHMALNIDECVEFTHLKQKVTAVIPTSNAAIECLMWSVFSLLLRSKPGGILEHFCVCINGPDIRTGNPELQDLKQKFLEELRDLEWYHTDNSANRCQMPLTVIRAWSRVGYAEAFEMALPWIHTDSYLLMHDDVFIDKKEWETEALEKFYADDDVAIAYSQDFLGCKVDSPIHRGMYLLRLPQLDSTFMLCKKKWVMKAEASWVAYFIPSDDNFFMFDFEDIDLDEFLKYYREKDLLDKNLVVNDIYNFARQGQGAWVYYKLCKLGKKFIEMNKDLVVHLGMMSRADVSREMKEDSIDLWRPEIDALEEEIMKHPEYSKLYEKYIKFKEF